MKWWITTLSLFVLLVLLERIFPVRGQVNEAFWPVESYFISLRGWIDSIGKCVINSHGVKSQRLQVSQASKVESGRILVKGKGRKGDLVVNKDGWIVGKVEKSWDNWVLVDTPLSDNFRMEVSVIKNNIQVVGKLIGGDPPLVKIPEDLNVKGGLVFISESEELGGYMRRMGRGEVGKIISRKGDFWMMKPTSKYEGLVILEK